MAGKYVVHTFGCQMNAHDSDRMTEVLEARGWTPADNAEEADLVVLNTCSVREKAEQKLRSEIGKLAPLKRRRPELVLAVAGCVAQQEGEALLDRVAHLDLVIGPDNLRELPELVREQQGGAPPRAETTFDLSSPRFLPVAPRPGQAPVSAWVTTMKGCDERCSFCIVPYTRGPERYRPYEDIVRDVRAYVDNGAREITLLGQTVDSYRDAALPPPASDDPDESQFPDLLRAVAREVPRLARLRYTSPHPRHLTPSLVRAHAEIAILARHVHMPVQSGSDRVLRRMIRRYTRAEYARRVGALRAACPDLTLSTDIIVGFPGETAEDFEATISLVQEMGFVSLFGFKYSPRPYTPALKLGDDVPEGEKSARLARLFEVSEAIGRDHLASLVGTRQRVLVEGASKGEPTTPGASRVQGRTERNEIVHLELPVDREAVGEIVEVEIRAAFKHSLSASPTPDALEALPARARRAPPRRERRSLPLAQ